MENRIAGLCQITAISIGVLSAIAALIGLFVNSLTLILTSLVSGCVSGLTFFALREVLTLQENALSAAADSRELLEKLLQKIDAMQPEPTVSARIEPQGEKRFAHFATRPEEEITCPNCGACQRASRNMCFECAAQFLFDDESG